MPPATLAELALRAACGAHFGVAQAAMDALVARWAQAKSDELVVAPRASVPRDGTYRVRRRRGRLRPYVVLLERLDPLVASCDCDDFLKNGLGACKHVLVVVGELTSTRASRLVAMRGSRSTGREARGRLAWDPRRSLAGPGHWLEGVRYRPAQPGRALAMGGSPSRRLHGLRWAPVGLAGEALALRPDPATLLRPAARAAWVEAIGALVAGPHNARLLVDPALRPLVRAAQEVDALRARAAQRAVAFRRALRSLRQRLYPYQRTGVERFLARGRLLLADDMGLGKTAQAVAACHALVRSGEVTRALVVVPASLKPQWAREWAQFTDVAIETVDGDAATRAARYRRGGDGVLLTNYEAVLKDLEAIGEFRPQLLVLDEAQRIKNWETRTAAAVKRIPAPWRLVLTGTPFENRLDELASLLDLVDERALQPLWRLAPWHVVATGAGRSTGGASHLSTLRERLAEPLLRRSRVEVLTQLPPRTDTRIPVELTSAQREAHDELGMSIARLVATASRRPLTREEFLRLMSLLTTQRVIVNGMAQLEFEERWPALDAVKRPSESLLQGLSSPKLLEFRELVRQVAIDQHRKVVVFSQWRRMIRLAHFAVRDVLADAGVRAVFFTGAESLRARTKSVVDLHDDETARLFFATDAGGVGLNLQRAATCVVHLELPWNPAVLEQRTARIHRIGQNHPIDVYALIGQDCIESRIADLVGDKAALFRGLFDGTSDEITFDRSGSFLSRLRAVVPPEAATGDETNSPEVEAGAARRLDAWVEAAAEPAQPTAATATTSIPPALGERMLEGVVVRRAPSGHVDLRVTPEAAARWIGVFQGLLASLGQSERR